MDAWISELGWPYLELRIVSLRAGLASDFLFSRAFHLDREALINIVQLLMAALDRSCNEHGWI